MQLRILLRTGCGIATPLLVIQPLLVLSNLPLHIPNWSLCFLRRNYALWEDAATSHNLVG